MTLLRCRILGHAWRYVSNYWNPPHYRWCRRCNEREML